MMIMFDVFEMIVFLLMLFMLMNMMMLFTTVPYT